LLRAAFVGVTRDFSSLPPGYIGTFLKFHLEVPWYVAEFGPCDVIVTGVRVLEPLEFTFPSGGRLRLVDQRDFWHHEKEVDLMVHWRKWNESLTFDYVPNYLNSQDHSYSQEWLTDVRNAHNDGKLTGILCFPTWHERQVRQEIKLETLQFISGLTLGVDDEVYRPSPQKDPYKLLWASDPGRGLQGAVKLATQLFARDKRFRLHVCCPDYVKDSIRGMNHPAIIAHGNLANGPELWNLFNTSGILPYTSTFKEPSSRAHRQAMAAGCVVYYPPDMGTPSELLDGGKGYVMPPEQFVTNISQNAGTVSHETTRRIAREYAVSESWKVQAKRFVNYFTKGAIE
jgi:glycosyltransferase involved in cell wall biosynthesis